MLFITIQCSPSLYLLNIIHSHTVIHKIHNNKTSAIEEKTKSNEYHKNDHRNYLEMEKMKNYKKIERGCGR